MERQSLLNQVADRSLFGGQAGQSLATVLNQIFYVGLVAAVALALFMVVRGGVQYMTTDSIDGKGGAKARIQAALGGLVLAFSAILILSTINPSLVTLSLKFDPVKMVVPDTSGLDVRPNVIFSASEEREGTAVGPDGVPIGQTNRTVPAYGPNGELVAQISNINNPDLDRASADGTIVLNGNTYVFRSGGGGNGYLPPGTYEITDGRLRSDNSSMMVDGYGYSFNLSDAYDSRVDANRTLLRIHPDGGSTGTIGCIGIQGNRATQEQFYQDMQATIQRNGGSYRITVTQ